MSFGDHAAPLALVDLGDTLSDCASALRAGFASLRRPGENALDEELVPLPVHLERRRREIMSAPGFWRRLVPRPPGFELLAILRAEGFQPHILSKGPRDAPNAWADKVTWCREHVPDVPVTITDDKSVVGGAVLVDDWVPYIERWQQRWRHGLTIVMAQRWNVDVVPGSLRIRFDGSAGEALHSALRGVRASLERPYQTEE